MGYSLECYLLDHAKLSLMVGSGRDDLLRSILEAEIDIFEANPRVPWRGALKELITGERGRALRQHQTFGEFGNSEAATEEEAIALVALVRSQGARIGELIHNTRAGEKFRQMFSKEFSPSPFANTQLLPRLLSNPLFGLTQDMYPSWGGLTHAELSQLIGTDSLAPTSWPADSDHCEWLYLLKDMVEQGVEEGCDMVTLYL
jgi:hypothetical protein